MSGSWRRGTAHVGHVLARLRCSGLHRLQLSFRELLHLRLLPGGASRNPSQRANHRGACVLYAYHFLGNCKQFSATRAANSAQVARLIPR
jgi:hypothetical protein